MRNTLVETICKKLVICGVDEVGFHRSDGISHIVSIRNPGIQEELPKWFAGQHLELFFGDVISVEDASRLRTLPPTLDDISRAIAFIHDSWREGKGKVLVNCDYGASRSPALAYVVLVGQLGPGLEQEAFKAVLDLRPDAVPNRLVVELGDRLLQREGRLMAPLACFYKEIQSLIDSRFEEL